MKIGIPRALYFFKYGKIWEEFFKEAGFDVIISPPTNRQILERGVALSVDELCIPLKVFYGHCCWLQKRCDFVFIPRYISLIKKTFTCPKLLVLPDTARFTIPDLPILTLSFKKSDEPGIIQFFLMECVIWKKNGYLNLRKKTFNPIKMHRLFKKLLQVEKEKTFKEPSFSPTSFLEPSIMVIGHPYNLEDSFVNHNLFKMLEELGVKVVTSRQIPARTIQKELDGLPFIYWSEEREIAGSAYFGLKNSSIDGIILVSSFGCGPDSLIAEQIVQDARQFKKPVMQLFLDENTSKINIETRLEAFVDMIRKKERKR